MEGECSETDEMAAFTLNSIIGLQWKAMVWWWHAQLWHCNATEIWMTCDGQVTEARHCICHTVWHEHKGEPLKRTVARDDWRRWCTTLMLLPPHWNILLLMTTPSSTENWTSIGAQEVGHLHGFPWKTSCCTKQMPLMVSASVRARLTVLQNCADCQQGPWHYWGDYYCLGSCLSSESIDGCLTLPAPQWTHLRNGAMNQRSALCTRYSALSFSLWVPSGRHCESVAAATSARWPLFAVFFLEIF